MQALSSLIALCAATASLGIAAPVDTPELGNNRQGSDPMIGMKLPLPGYDPKLDSTYQLDPKLAPTLGSFGEVRVFILSRTDEMFPVKNPNPGHCTVYIHGSYDPRGTARVSLCTFDTEADPEYQVKNEDVNTAFGNLRNSDGIVGDPPYLGGMVRIPGPQPMYALMDRTDMLPPKI